MPHYFFDIHDGVEIIDKDGEDFPDIKAVRERALRLAGGFSAMPKMLGEDGGAIVVSVREGGDSVILTVRLVFTVEGG